MTISLKIFLAILIIVNSVNSADLLKWQARRGLEEVSPPFYSNHPPSIETHIPVTVIYEAEEDIHVLNESKEHSTTEDDIIPRSSSKGEGVLRAGKLHVNPTDKEESVLTSIPTNDGQKPSKNLNKEPGIVRGRSLNFETLGSKNNQILTNNTRNKVRKHTQRKRLHRVNKVTDNKNQVDGNNKSNNVAKKGVPEQVILSKINDTDQSARIPTFPKRTGGRDPIVPIINSENYVFAYSGDYHYSYEGGDGTKAFERGELRTVDDGSSGTGVVGGYSYTDKDGIDFSLSYTADENGYRPIGAHLPTSPPIPPAIQRALDYLATKTTPEPVTERVKSN